MGVRVTLSDKSAVVIVPALQRYVIAWTDAARARKQLARAEDTMRAERREVEAVVSDPVPVELLDGGKFVVHNDVFGLVVREDRG